MAKRPLCVHCGIRPRTRPKRLCQVCWKLPDVADRYPPAPARKPRDMHEPTEAELDAMIQQQMATLPRWWQAEDGK